MKTTREMIGLFYKPEDHPYRIYEAKIGESVKNTDTVLDAGCGRSAPILRKFVGKAKTLIGIDLVEKEDDYDGINYFVSDISSMDNIKNESVDLVISRAVLEHVECPEKVFNEINRILQKNGKFIFLVPNLYDYASLLSIIIPNKYHANIVNKAEGRSVNDTFPAFYKVNSFKQIKEISEENGFSIVSFDYLGQYPSYFMFSRVLFLLGVLYDKIICRFEIFKFLRGWLLVVLEKKID